MKLELLVRELSRAEHHLYDGLHAIAARHKADSDIHHIALDLAGWSQDHLRQLSEQGHDRKSHLSPLKWPVAVSTRIQEWMSEPLRKRPEPALLLLADLRRIHLMAAGASLDWELLAQAAQAAKDTDLLELASRCHPETLRQMRWANAMLKELSPQVLTS
jgi:hypothetical protein